MNIIRSSTLLVLGLIILVAERIYFVHKSDVAIKSGESVDIAAQNSTFNDYNQYLQGTRAPKNTTINTNAYATDSDNEKNVLHTTTSRLKPSSNSRIYPNSNDPWDRYSDQLPKVFLLANAAQSGVTYQGATMPHLKNLADSGDILAKFFYGYNLSKGLDAEYSYNKVVGDINARTAEIRQLYIESAAKGLHASAHELSRLYYSGRMRDLVEALSWALIADAMRDGGEKSVSKICSEKNSPCTSSALAQATARAHNYLNTYAFKIEGGGAR